MAKIQKIQWADARYVTNAMHVAIVRELACYHCICPECCKLGMDLHTGDLYEQTKNSAFHWSRSFEWPWAILNGGLSKDHVCLDAAGGHAVFQQALCRRVGQVTNVDMNKQSLDAAYSLAQTLGHTNLRVWKGDLIDIPTPNETYDRVFCISVVEHCSNWREIIQELLRVLKPGGSLILTMDVVRSDLRDVDSKASGFHVGFPEAGELCLSFGGELPPIGKPILTNMMPCGTVLSCLAMRVQK